MLRMNNKLAITLYEGGIFRKCHLDGWVKEKCSVHCFQGFDINVKMTKYSQKCENNKWLLRILSKYKALTCKLS